MTAEVGNQGRVAQLLHEHEDRLIKRWTEIVSVTLRGRLTEGEVSRQSRELLAVLATTLSAEGGGDLSGPAAGELRAVLAELSRSRARRGFSSTETAVSVFGLKDAVLDVLDEHGDAEALRDFLSFSRLMDQLGLYTFEVYAQTREDLIAEQAQQLLELSTPVVKLWDGVVAVPLIGTLDSARAQVVMEKLLQMLVDTGSAYAIIDITGVPAVDTQVAQHVLKTVVAARLMGAECVISGIRPQIAQTIVALGIEFGDIVTKASLADALMHTLRASGVELVVHRSRAGT
ncbi:MAG TPA: STAS domain-containing protein [Micromonosporaceae bacterium]|nr:STAS domain-containing protein [Micromonosporaceae bacterium]